MNFGIEMPREAGQTAFSRFLCSFKCLQRSARRENLVDVALGLNRVHLPEVDMVRLQQAERCFQILLCPLGRALC